jgi:hypothetical protein
MGHENLQEAGESASQAQFAILVFFGIDAQYRVVLGCVRLLETCDVGKLHISVRALVRSKYSNPAPCQADTT